MNAFRNLAHNVNLQVHAMKSFYKPGKSKDGSSVPYQTFQSSADPNSLGQGHDTHSGTKDEHGLDLSEKVPLDLKEWGDNSQLDSGLSGAEEEEETVRDPYDKISAWQAGWNVTNAIQGMFIVSFPYAVLQGGYLALLAMVIVAVVCCYTGKILVQCLYIEVNADKSSLPAMACEQDPISDQMQGQPIQEEAPASDNEESSGDGVVDDEEEEGDGIGERQSKLNAEEKTGISLPQHIPASSDSNLKNRGPSVNRPNEPPIYNRSDTTASVKTKRIKMRRIYANYGDVAGAVFGPWFGRSVVNAAQLLELLMTCILYVLIVGDLLSGSFRNSSLPLSFWITFGAMPLIPCAFLTTLRRVSTLSMWCTVAHFFINIIIVIYCFTLVNQWNPSAVAVLPDIWTFPLALGIIVFSYTSQIFLPSLEGKLKERSHFGKMMNVTHVAAAIFKVVFAYIAFITWGADTKEVITNNLPDGLKGIVNIILIGKAWLSYPLPFFAAAEMLEGMFFVGQPHTRMPSCYGEQRSLKWWSVLLRISLVGLTILMAIWIPYFALLMALIGSFTGTMLSLVWPCLFHLKLMWVRLTVWDRVIDIVIIVIGTVFGLIGMYYSSHALVRASQGYDPRPWVRLNSTTPLNGTLIVGPFP